MSNFAFLNDEFPQIAAEAKKAEAHAPYEPRLAGFYGRRTLELAVYWLYDNDADFRPPYYEQNTLVDLLKDSSFRKNVPQGIQQDADIVRRLGNSAVHDKHDIRQRDSSTLIKALFQVLNWLARTYRRDNRTPLPLQFNPQLVPTSAKEQLKQTQAQIQKLETEQAERDKEERKAKAKLIAENEAQKAEIEKLQAQVAANKAHNNATQPQHNYDKPAYLSEAETRETLINLMLREAGWDPDGENVAEYPVVGMSSMKSGRGKADYVLWGYDGKPLAVIEAKSTQHDAKKGEMQAKEYADCLEQMHQQRPIIFYTNGYDIYLWDDERYPPRKVQGYFTKKELQLMVQRRQTAKELANIQVNQDIVNRDYQLEAIRRITERFNSKHRSGLLVMATGTGKTRTAIALVDVLMRAHWVKRVLFLADRKTLVKQAVNAFKKHLPSSNPINLLLDKEAAESRVVVSTYQTMMGQIDLLEENNKRLFNVGHFDLIIIDEAHRSIYQKFGAIFTYFDSLLLGLTATPREEVDRNTYEMFTPVEKAPTFAYGLEEAVQNGYLVPPNLINIQTNIMHKGLKYAELSPKDKEHWDSLEWGESKNGKKPEEVASKELYRKLYNKETIDKVLGELMKKGIKVEGGDRLGKTIIFAQNQKHAEQIERRFRLAFPQYKGKFACTIHSKEAKAEQLISDFSQKDSEPFIAVSVDMLDTGVDIPEVLNLLIFKVIYSRTKFLQMLGRGTRLCPDLFAPDEDKAHFNVFDACGNFSYFDENFKGRETPIPESLSQKNFKHRLHLIQLIDTGSNAKIYNKQAEEQAKNYAKELLDTLYGYVQGMAIDSFMVRPNRKYLDPFRKRERWQHLSNDDIATLAKHVSNLPSAQQQEDEGAKRFDNLVLQLQIAFLEKTAEDTVENTAPNDENTEASRAYTRHKNRVMEIATNLATRQSKNIYSFQEKLELIKKVQGEQYWQDIDLSQLEELRKELRHLVKSLDKKKRHIIYSNFSDEIPQNRQTQFNIFKFSEDVNIDAYRKQVEKFLHQHKNDDVMIKIRTGLPLNNADIEKLAALLFSAQAIESREKFTQAYGEQKNLALFIRRIVGMDKEAVKDAFVDYLNKNNFTADQISFVRHIIDHLSKNGTVEAAMFYERPFTDVHEAGIEGLFDKQQIDSLMAIIHKMNTNIVLEKTS